MNICPCCKPFTVQDCRREHFDEMCEKMVQWFDDAGIEYTNSTLGVFAIRWMDECAKHCEKTKQRKRGKR